MQRIRQTMTITSANTASTTVGTVLATGLDACDSLTILGALAGHTGGTLDVYIQTTFDEGTTWYDFAHFTQLAAGAAAIKYAWNVSRDSTTAILTLGTGSTPVLAAGAIIGGGWGNSMRLVTVGGAGTSAGAAQSVHVFGIKNLH